MSPRIARKSVHAGPEGVDRPRVRKIRLSARRSVCKGRRTPRVHAYGSDIGGKKGTLPHGAWRQVVRESEAPRVTCRSFLVRSMQLPRAFPPRRYESGVGDAPAILAHSPPHVMAAPQRHLASISYGGSVARGLVRSIAKKDWSCARHALPALRALPPWHVFGCVSGRAKTMPLRHAKEEYP